MERFKTMKNFEVTYRLNGKVYRQVITTTTSIKAREILRNLLPHAVITGAREV